MSAPNSTNYAWPIQPAVRSSCNGDNQAVAQSATPASQSKSSAVPAFSYPMTTSSSQISNSPPTLQPKAVPDIITGHPEVLAGLGDNDQQATRPNFFSFASRSQDEKVDQSTTTARTNENLYQPILFSSLPSSSSQKPSPPFFFSSQKSKEATTSREVGQKEDGRLSSSPALPPSVSSIFGHSQLSSATSTSQASQQVSRPPSTQQGPLPFPTSISPAKQPETDIEVKAPRPAVSLSTFTASQCTASVAGTTAVGSAATPEAKSELGPSASVQVTPSTAHPQSGTARPQTDVLNEPQSLPVPNVMPEVKPTAGAVPTSISKDSIEPVNESRRGFTTAQGTTIPPQDTKSAASAVADVSVAEGQQEPSRSKPHSYGIDEDENNDLATSTTSLDSIATAEVKLPGQVEQMHLESENGQLKSTSTFLITEIGVLTKQIQSLRQENERLMQLADSRGAIESQMQRVTEENVSLIVKCDKMQNAFALIDDESSLPVRTVAIYDCPYVLYTCAAI
ncbi:hypothetical protein V1509DRAFT_111352 [Lipomyces kononenkoae]